MTLRPWIPVPVPGAYIRSRSVRSVPLRPFDDEEKRYSRKRRSAVQLTEYLASFFQVNHPIFNEIKTFNLNERSIDIQYE